MIIATSLSPNHPCDINQLRALQSWQDYGDIYSLNHPDEIDVLDYDNVLFISIDRTVKLLFKKPLININSFFDFALTQGEDLLIINSDIILDHLPEFRKDGITVLSRYDYTDSFEDAILFESGFDAFFIPKQFLNWFPPSIYAMGAAWWDYWIPKWAIIQNIPLYYPQGRFAYHKIHPTQYDIAEWLRMGEYFKLEFIVYTSLTIPQIASQTLSKIKEHFICQQ